MLERGNTNTRKRFLMHQLLVLAELSSQCNLYYFRQKMIGIIYESFKEYLKKSSTSQHDCNADIIARNRSEFDPSVICGENSFLPTINSLQDKLDLNLLFQSLDSKK